MLRGKIWAINREAEQTPAGLCWLLRTEIEAGDLTALEKTAAGRRICLDLANLDLFISKLISVIYELAVFTPHHLFFIIAVLI